MKYDFTKENPILDHASCWFYADLEPEQLLYKGQKYKSTKKLIYYIPN